MEPLQRVTAATVEVLGVLLEGPEPVWGLQIIKRTQRLPGTIYPILERLERQGWVVSCWEEDQSRPGPRRKLYTFTTDGAEAARGVCSAHARRQVGAVAAETSRPATS